MKDLEKNRDKIIEEVEKEKEEAIIRDKVIMAEWQRKMESEEKISGQEK